MKMLQNRNSFIVFATIGLLVQSSVAGLFGGNSDSQFVDAVYSAFQKQNQYYETYVRPQRDQTKKLKEWGQSARLMASALQNISSNGVSDNNLIRLKNNVESAAAVVAGLLLSENAISNQDAIMRASSTLDTAQAAFDAYVQKNRY